MIAGPELTDDRASVIDLLASQPDLIEKDLVLVEQDLGLGPLSLDGLLRDAAGRPTLLFVLASDDGGDVASRVLDADAWVRENFFMLRRFLGHTGIHWDMPPRSIVVGNEVQPAPLRRLQSIKGVEIDLFELRSLRVRGQMFWAGVPRLGPCVGNGSATDTPVPSTIKDPEVRGLWENLVGMVRQIDREIVLEGDRYREDVVWKGQRLATLGAAEGVIRVTVTVDEVGPKSLSSVSDPFLVHDQRSLRLAVDALMRRYLAVLGRPWLESLARRAEAASAAARPVEGGREEIPGFMPHVLRSS